VAHSDILFLGAVCKFTYLLTRRLLVAASEDDATMQEMKRLCDKVTEMQNQRQMFEQQFRDELQKDDLTVALVTQGDKNQEVWTLDFVFLTLLCSQIIVLFLVIS